MLQTLANPKTITSSGIHKSPTGIEGLDAITLGGLPAGRPTLICGGAGCGKTLMAMEFLVRGAIQYGEPGVFLAFEENPVDLARYVSSLGYDLEALERSKKVSVEYLKVDRANPAEVTGEFDLGGLFIRLQHAIDSIGAKRVAIDTLETIFGGFDNEALLRAELVRLFDWIKDRGITTVITAEKGDGPITRKGLEEYVSDCVIMLDHRTANQISTRRLRVLKYRGSVHGTNEYPFLIDENGISVLPISSASLDHQAYEERVSTGIPRLDNMFEGKGYYRGSTILVSGTAGSGKTSIANFFSAAACKRGERALYFAFEESPSQIKRNMRSLGLDLQPWIDNGALRILASRPTVHGLELHLVNIHKQVERFKPSIVVIDPMSSLTAMGDVMEVNSMLVRLIDFLKSQGITAMFVSLMGSPGSMESTELGISSLIDTWIQVKDTEFNSERNRLLYVLKSRGIAHSNQIREFLITSHGIDLMDVYVGPSGVATGSSRLALEAREKSQNLQLEQEITGMRLDLERRRKVMEARLAALDAEFKSEEQELKRLIEQKVAHHRQTFEDRRDMARSRRADIGPLNGSSKGNSI
ncbi:MAG: circadian clock protein KaiC [Fibrobacteres bacterium]|nr:circadian clock protein KaiC [Fibrobacterota bacterium]